jgi:capsular polysaccharide biosynthesis protein
MSTTVPVSASAKFADENAKMANAMCAATRRKVASVTEPDDARGHIRNVGKVGVTLERQRDPEEYNTPGKSMAN